MSRHDWWVKGLYVGVLIWVALGVRRIVKTLELHRLTDSEIELISLFRQAGASGKLILMLARTAAGELPPSNVVPIRPDIETAVV